MRFALDCPPLSSCNPTAFIAFLNLTIDQALPPADHRTKAQALGWDTTDEHLQKSCCVAGRGSGANGMPTLQRPPAH